jgi:hypothetical protein
VLMKPEPLQAAPSSSMAAPLALSTLLTGPTL